MNTTDDPITQIKTREDARGYVDAIIQRKLIKAFDELDDLVVALSPDCPQPICDAWTLLYDQMTPGFLALRAARRGFSPPDRLRDTTR